MVYYIDSKIPEFLIGDQGKIRQIIVNLLGNAIKFTESGNIFLEIKLVNFQGNINELEFSVEDTGIGISDDIGKKIFQPFVQGDLTYTKQYQGTGLGLSISKRLIELMGGEIWYESEEGKGTKFLFRIGLKKSDKHYHNSEKVELDFSKLTVLFIDDNSLNRKITRLMLEESGTKVFDAESGEKGIEILKLGEQIDLILLDVHMPNTDGFQTAKLIKEIFGEKYLILMFTSVDVRGEIDKMKELGVADYMMKPVKRKELLYKIRETINANYSIEIEKNLEEIEGSIDRIVVVEDNNINLSVAVKMLNSLGYKNIYTASNGKEAIEVVKNYNPDMIFMDIQMPIMNGFEAFEYIKKLKIKQVKVIAMTAYAMEKDREKCLEAGMNGFISKPFTIDELKYTLENVYKKNNR